MDELPVRIGRLAALSGVTVRTLRVYEQRGLIKPVHRHANGYRYYDASLQVPIRAMGAALSLGLSLADVAELFAHVKPMTREPNHDEARICLQQAVDVYRRHLARIDQTIRKLEDQRAGIEIRIDYCTNDLTRSGLHRIAVPTGITRHRIAGRVEYERS